MTRNSFVYLSQLIWQAQEQQEMQTTHVNCFIAQCRTCWQIIASIPDDLAQTHKTAEQIDEWRQQGYMVSRVTQMYLDVKGVGRCTCDKGAA